MVTDPGGWMVRTIDIYRIHHTTDAAFVNYLFRFKSDAIIESVYQRFSLAMIFLTHWK